MFHVYTRIKLYMAVMLYMATVTYGFYVTYGYYITNGYRVICSITRSVDEIGYHIKVYSCAAPNVLHIYIY